MALTENAELAVQKRLGTDYTLDEARRSPFNLRDRVGLISGASRGLGKDIAYTYAIYGARLMLLSTKKGAAELEEVAKDVQSMGVEVETFNGDLSLPDTGGEVVKKTIDRFKGLDILVNNAGITKDGSVLRMSDDDFMAVLNLNLRGVHNLTRPALRYLLRSQYGRVINIGSISQEGNPYQANYAASKGGLVSYTQAVASEIVERRVTANVIAYAGLDTDIWGPTEERIRNARKITDPNVDPLAEIKAKHILTGGRFIRPDEAADWVHFLATDRGSQMTGQVLVVDAGATLFGLV